VSKKANPTIIGTFVIVAFALAASALIILGNIQLQEKTLSCVLYFTGSLHGLDVGAPVTMRGVPIGRVTKIQLDFNQNRTDYSIPVYIEINQGDGEKFPPLELQREKERAKQLIDSGLRAKLKIRSIVTGKLYIDLAFYPNSELRINEHIENSKYIEIPTLPSELEQLSQTLTDIPIQAMVNKVVTILESINQLLTSKKGKQALEHLYASLENIDQLVNDAKTEMPELSARLQDSLIALENFSKAGTALMQVTQNEIPELSGGLQQSIASINTAANTLTATLDSLEKLIDEDSDFAYDFSRLSKELQETAKGIRHLAEDLQRYPNALIFGKPGTK